VTIRFEHSGESTQAEKQKPSHPSVARRSWGPAWREPLPTSVAEEARTRGFAAPAFAGCAFVVGLATLSYREVRGLSSDQRARLDTGFLG
jgi:hypothetical protein